MGVSGRVGLLHGLAEKMNCRHALMNFVDGTLRLHLRAAGGAGNWQPFGRGKKLGAGDHLYCGSGSPGGGASPNRPPAGPASRERPNEFSGHGHHPPGMAGEAA